MTRATATMAFCSLRFTLNPANYPAVWAEAGGLALAKSGPVRTPTN